MLPDSGGACAHPVGLAPYGHEASAMDASKDERSKES